MNPPDPKEEVVDDVDLDEPEANEADAEPGEGDADTDGDADADGEGYEDSSAGRAGSEGTEEVDGEGEAEPPRRRSASDVIRDNKRGRKAAEVAAQEAQRKADEALRRAEEAERRAQEAERRATERRQQESEAEETARLELMSETEKLEHFRKKDAEAHKREMDGVKFQIWDSTDRSEFRQLCREDRLVASVKDQVEAEYDRLRTAGRPVSREILANQFIAKKVRENRSKAVDKQSRQAAEGVRRQTVKPPRTTNGAAAPRSRRGEVDDRAARRKRLEDVTL